MQLPALNIRSVHGKIGLQTNRPQLQVKQHSADLAIKQEHTLIKMKQQHGKISIDQSEAFASAGSKHIFDLMKEWAAKGLQKVNEATVKYAREGEMMKKIENGGNPVPQFAKQNSVLFPEREWRMVAMPFHNSVKVHVQPSHISYDVTGGNANVQINRREPTIEYRPWQTDVYIRQQNSINIQVVGGQVNRGV